MNKHPNKKIKLNNKIFHIKPVLFFLASLCITNAWAAADGNNSRIQALEAEDTVLHQRIDTIQLTPGSAGADGAQGPAGPQGLPGTDGAQGPTGPQGLPGADGAQGPAGSQGLPGADGEQGPAGTNGSDGADGTQGTAGISCWDLNGNNINDAGEDINNDGAFNALDCAGNVDLSSILQRLTSLEDRLQHSDFDNDGYTPATGDCNDADPDIFTGAYEIIGDNLDNNCDGDIDLLSTEDDFDGDGLTNFDEENTYQTDPQNADSDNDSLPEKYVPKYELSCWWESYSCGAWGISTCWSKQCRTVPAGQDYFPPVNMSDGNEVNVYMTDPNLSDTDGDGINDGLEIRNDTNPLDANSF